MRITIKATGVKEALERIGNPDELIKKLDEVTEQNTRLMANNAASKAPVDTGLLRSSIPASVEKEQEMVWQFGSNVPYARRQEYEHRSKKAFFRRSLWEGRTKYRGDIQKTIRDFTS